MSRTKKEVDCNFEPIPTTSRIIATIAIIISCGLVLGCGGESNSPQLTPEQESAIADSVRSLTEETLATWNELNPEPYLDYYSEDLHFYYQGSHLPRNKFEEVVRKQMDLYQEFTTEMSDPQVEVLGPDASVVSFKYKGTAVDTAGNPDSLDAALTVIFERRNDGWKIVQAHESIVPSQDSPEE